MPGINYLSQVKDTKGGKSTDQSSITSLFASLGGGWNETMYNKLLETGRHTAFKDFVSLINKAITTDPSKSELKAEGDSLAQRLREAKTDKLIAAIYGAAGNPVAVENAKRAGEQVDLLSYLYSAYRDNPKQYMQMKKADLMSKIAPFAQGAGQLVASGGEGKSEAAQAVAMMAQAQNQLAIAALSGQAGKDQGAEDFPVVPWMLLMSYMKAGGSANDDIGKDLKKSLKNDSTWQMFVRSAK